MDTSLSTTQSRPPGGGRSRSLSLSPQVLNIVGLVVAIVILCIVLSITAPHFGSVRNFYSILQSAADVGIIAWAGTLVIVAGEIDISVGPAVAFWSVMLAEMAGPWHLGLGVALVVTLVGGGLVGAFAGWLRAHFGVPSFVVTLGLWLALRGQAEFLTNALPVPIADNRFMDFIGGALPGGFPVSAVIMFVLFALYLFISRRTSFGRSVFAVGGNAKAAMLSGIKVARVRVLVFVGTGLLSAVVGIITAGRLTGGNATAADGLEFDVIAAVVVGGTSLAGGRGSMLGTLLGVFFIAIIGNGLILLGVNPFFQNVVSGIVIVGAVLINLVLSRRGARDAT
ncbi:sugar ABC transporter permease [Frondihabitans sp. PAMC 28766]|uniref:ABC transporter permease n=1 Tax=Frondihabitans sp. PAMC 28766 TaxID=1795630 RepID=UPI00078BEF0C|nr:ABC transporter permease [Frondihabitans sp. PAMC 28766]AMM20195.1 sugar ABC transporter permease [Frondihabitans sp. PAMC 28766]